MKTTDPYKELRKKSLTSRIRKLTKVVSTCGYWSEGPCEQHFRAILTINGVVFPISDWTTRHYAEEQRTTFATTLVKELL